MDGGFSAGGGLRVLYATTWGYAEGLSVASARPTLRALAAFPEVEEILYLTFDATSRPRSAVAAEIAPKVAHLGLPVDRRLAAAGALGGRYLGARRVLRREAEGQGIGLAICRGATAAALGLFLKARYGTPLVVESFEPHADYMAASGQWRRFGPTYTLQKRIERQAIRRADRIVTVSRGYADHLAAEKGVEKCRLDVLPCRADPAVFFPDAARREEMRKRLGLAGPVCVYAGKFGGLYLAPAEAAQVLRSVREALADTGLSILVLTPDAAGPVREAFAAAGLGSCTTILKAAPVEVPAFLNAADFAISFHRSSRWSFAFSPIKHAEYWASGLPVLCPARIGDDAGRIPGTPLGSVADFGDREAVTAAARAIGAIIRRENYRAEVRNSWLDSFDRNEVAALYEGVIGDAAAAVLGAGKTARW